MFLDTGTLQGSTSASVLDTGILQNSSFVELDTGTLQGGTFYAELDTGTLQGSRPVPQEFVDLWTVPNPDRWETIQSGKSSALVRPIYEVRFRISVNGVVTDLSPYLIDLSIDRPLGGKATCKASFTQHSPGGLDADGYPLPDLFARMQVKQTDFNPLFLGRNAYTTKILSHRYDLTRTAQISIRIQTESGWQTWNAPTFLLGTPKLNGDGVLEWAGEDIITLLEKERPYGEDIVPGDNSIEFAHATIRSICAARGITSVDIQFPDYPIRQLRMTSGTPRRWIEEICEPYQAHMYVDGNTLILRPARFLTEGAEWAWQDYLNISGLTVEQTEGWKNKFILSRQRDQSGVVSEERRCYGNHCVGEQTISLDEPSHNVVVLLKVGGYAQIRFKDFDFYDELGVKMNGVPFATGFYSAPRKIASVKFVSEPFFFGGTQAANQMPSMGPSTLNGVNVNDPNALAAFTPEYTWVVFGGSEASATANQNPADAFDTPFSFEVSDAATTALWGELPDGENIEMAVIPNAEVGQAAANALLHENIRQIFTCGFETPYVNPWITPNQIFSLTHYRTAQQQLKWLVESAQINYSADKSITQTFSLRRGLVG